MLIVWHLFESANIISTVPAHEHVVVLAALLDGADHGGLALRGHAGQHLKVLCEVP